MTTKSYTHLSAGNVGAITTLMIRDMFADHELPVDEAVVHKYEDLAHKILIHLRVEPQSTQAAARIEALEAGLKAAIRAANFALFVIRKKGVMPNDSWKTGFEGDMEIARAALAAEQDK